MGLKSRYYLRANVKRSAILIMFCAFVLSASIFGFTNQTVSASTGADTRNIYLAAIPDFGGPGHNVFSPGALVVQQGDQVNLTLRNSCADGFHLTIENYLNSSLVQPGLSNSSAIVPVETSFSFTASKAGVFNYYSEEHPEMEGQLIVLPSNWSYYSPQAQSRSFSQLVIPDFAGPGYDKYFPGVMFANQGDNVSISIINTDDMPHGFSLPAFGINIAVNAGQDAPNGTIIPLTTTVPAFNASQPGIYEFLCTVYCGSGHSQMVGYFVVLPSGNSSYNPTPAPAYRYLEVKPDFVGPGYDKYLPETIVVNQNDLVYIVVRNTDDMTHGFALPAFSILNATVAPGVDLPGGGIDPTDTYITPFFATQSGSSDFFCTIYCGLGHDQMVGSIVVLPALSPPGQPAVPSAGINFGLIIVVILGALLIGIFIGLLFNRGQKMPK